VFHGAIHYFFGGEARTLYYTILTYRTLAHAGTLDNDGFAGIEDRPDWGNGVEPDSQVIAEKRRPAVLCRKAANDIDRYCHTPEPCEKWRNCKPFPLVSWCRGSYGRARSPGRPHDRLAMVPRYTAELIKRWGGKLKPMASGEWTKTYI